MYFCCTAFVDGFRDEGFLLADDLGPELTLDVLKTFNKKFYDVFKKKKKGGSKHWRSARYSIFKIFLQTLANVQEQARLPVSQLPAFLWLFLIEAPEIRKRIVR